VGKAIGFGLLVLGLWVVLEVQLEGTRGAFGGALAGLFGPAPRAADGAAPPPDRVTERVRERVTGHMERAAERRERLSGLED